MWGVSMDPEGNYLLLGGSGDEYSYSAESNGQVHTKFEPDNIDLTYRQFGWIHIQLFFIKVSDIWVSYLVVVSKNGDKLFEGTYGNPGILTSVTHSRCYTWQPRRQRGWRVLDGHQHRGHHDLHGQRHHARLRLPQDHQKCLKTTSGFMK